MIEFLSSWAKSLGLAIIIVSILEMLLPNNKTKKYIRMILGIFILFNIISPFVGNKDLLNIDNFDLDSYTTTKETSNIDQKSMDDKIIELYTKELEKDITSKVEQQGFEVSNCKVEAQIGNEDEETKITKINLKIKNKYIKTNDTSNTQKESNTIENKIIVEVQKIKPVDDINNENTDNNLTSTIGQTGDMQNDESNLKKQSVTKVEIQNLKKFLIDEYGVSEKCLEIN